MILFSLSSDSGLLKTLDSTKMVIGSSRLYVLSIRVPNSRFLWSQVQDRGNESWTIQVSK